MVRPQIPEILKDRVEETHIQHRDYPPNSFQEALSTVLDLAEKHIEEELPSEELPFEYGVEDSSDGRKDFYIFPDEESGFKLSDSDLVTPKAKIESSSIVQRLEKVEGVQYANVHDDEIHLRLGDEPNTSYPRIVDEVFEVLADVIRDEEGTISEIEERADKYASRRENS